MGSLWSSPPSGWISLLPHTPQRSSCHIHNLEISLLSRESLPSYLTLSKYVPPTTCSLQYLPCGPTSSDLSVLCPWVPWNTCGQVYESASKGQARSVYNLEQLLWQNKMWIQKMRKLINTPNTAPVPDREGTIESSYQSKIDCLCMYNWMSLLKLTQHCKSTILQFGKTKSYSRKKKKKRGDCFELCICSFREETSDYGLEGHRVNPLPQLSGSPRWQPPPRRACAFPTGSVKSFLISALLTVKNKLQNLTSQ